MPVTWTAEHIETSRTNGRIERRNETVQTVWTDLTDIMTGLDKPDGIDKMLEWTGHAAVAAAQRRQGDDPLLR